MKFPHTMLDVQDPIFAKAESDDILVQAGHHVLKAIGEDPSREGVLKTPARFAKAWREICSGYSMTAAQAVGEGIFAGEGKGLVSVKDIEYYSMCEHHMLPFWGKVSVAYYPDKKILGLSKIPRVVDVFAKRLQVQERLTREIGEAISTLIDARAVGVRAHGCHMCMMMRGVKKTHSETMTEFFVGLENLTPDESARLQRSLD